MVIQAVLGALAKVGSRAKRAGDTLYNARRRYIRRAERLFKQADKSIGADAVNKREAAKRNLNDAVRLYENERDKARFVSKMKNKYGVDLSDIKSASPAQRSYLINESYETLSGASRERFAKEIMSSAAGKRIMASTADIWKSAVKVNADGKTVIDTSLAYSLITQHFGVDSMADVIDIYERELGEDLYSDPDSDEFYKSVVRRAIEFMRDLGFSNGR